MQWGPSNPEALNRYSYALNNPVRYTDPTGHSVYLSKAESQQYVKALNEFADVLRNVAYGAMTVAAATSLIGKIFPGGMGIAAAFISRLATFTATYLLMLAAQVEDYAQLIKDNTGDTGVILAADCGVFRCEMTVLNRDTGNGGRFQASVALTWSTGMMQDKFQVGKACNRFGGNATNGNFYIHDHAWCI